MQARINIHGRSVDIIGTHNVQLVVSKEFVRYMGSVEKSLLIKSIHEEWSWFSKKGELIFGIFYVEYFDDAGKPRGEIFFFRSDSVAVLLVLREKISNKRFVVLVEQTRIPAGGNILEIPAGSCEIGENDVETMTREIREEVGPDVSPDDIHFLGKYYFSPGACSEQIALYYSERTLFSKEINDLRDRIAGLQHHGEKTKVTLVPIEEFENMPIRDAKTMLAFQLYKNHVVDANGEKNMGKKMP